MVTKLTPPGAKPRVLSNSLWLGALQLLNVVLPLLLLPFLVRTLGTELSGVVFFGFAAVMLASVGTDFGFNLAATYRIASLEGNIEETSRVVTAILVAKLLVTSSVVVLYVGFVAIEQKYAAHDGYLLLLLLSIVGQAFQPVWFFQGIERMLNITLLTAAARATYVATVLVLVNGPEDYQTVAVANGLSLILAAALGLGRMMTYGIRWRWDSWRRVWLTLRESAAFFGSRAANAVYTYGGTFVVGLAVGPVQVAHYAAAEQLYRGGQSFVNPVVQALFPHMTKTRDLTYLYRWLKVISGLALLMALVGFAVGRPALGMLFGPDYGDSYGTLAIFLLVFLVATPSVILGYPLFGALGDIRPANRSVVLGGLLGCALYAVLAVAGGVSGFRVALCILLVEIVVVGARVHAWRRLVCGGSEFKGEHI